jgi:xanthine dehydrogenase small subunit
MSKTIRFLLGDDVREVAVDDPACTVLEYLRGSERRCGTKEGCAEGDCGACTVVLGEADGAGGVRYRTVNSCIQFLPTLDGRHLLTVEDLADPADGSLHPVQAALAEGYGAQCGFCTPGFVMSLYAFHRSGRAATPDAISDHLAGNLCRCTGYRPIIEAAQRAAELPVPPRQTAREAAAADLLCAWSVTAESLAIETDAGAFYAPLTLAEAISLRVSHPQATLLAGGTDVGLWVTKQHRHLSPVLWLGRVKELQQIISGPDSLFIGAGVSFEDALPHVGALHPDLAELLRRIGSVQVRAAGTLGGNIANGSPIGDSMPALIALGAVLHLAGPEGERRMPLEEFYLAYRRTALGAAEIVTGVTIPRLTASRRFGAYKISKRFDQDISALCPAFCLTLEGETITAARIAFGGMAGTPARAPLTEAALTGKPFAAETFRSAMEKLAADYQPLSDMRASAAYRTVAARNCLWRFWLEQSGAEQVRLDPRGEV